MTFTDKLKDTIRSRDSLLCIGLDPDLQRLPQSLLSESNPLLKFCSEIIASTSDLCAAYKINFAFFEVEGAKGWQTLEAVRRCIPEHLLAIADAKRADIGNTSQKYAQAILQNLDFDAVTVNPYMGEDSVAPFMQWPEKGAFILALTSNPGSYDFQHLQINARPLYKKILKEVLKWNVEGNCGAVVGATHPGELETVRNLCPDLPFLIPGVGVQGGSLHDAIKYGTDQSGGLALINSSRGIIYKSSGKDFADAARKEAERLKKQMNRHRKAKQATLVTP